MTTQTQTLSMKAKVYEVPGLDEEIRRGTIMVRGDNDVYDILTSKDGAKAYRYLGSLATEQSRRRLAKII